ncbi:MAG: KUP/HAK/KT family potassium transporter [Bacteroidia bacterium]|nr:KUP/HAK/KT family potassium transporter [Bacteroidota bacterium]MBK7430885.1 KUP/HAK/KT family potassium transporter [Bacteroidota bacterium]MBK8585523.1 KUP/HAK/KT family potassium transporter [Bacteroidota bacterium]MBP9791289.1 KUP/HAK/KT family potassium transporter [Bacteroidia bacterium]MBP9924248.1 KUP/HAK/KT family potassium transporter [Bacteroidia bacterium]
MLLITLGIIYGDIGTSPLYVMKAIVGKQPINPEVVLGGISCIFWTLTIQTTFKYVMLTLRADNKGEGGIFSLYALIRRTKVRWLIWPAIIGGSALLADGIITPPISVSSAIEGLRMYNPEIPTVPIVIAILTALFFIQQFGTKFVGNFFGPVMLIWFSTIAVLGIYNMAAHPYVLKAFNPYYAIHLITQYPGGFWLLGAVFLCTTGAEALYSDLGHCGRKNIRITWVFVKISLLLNYLGQSAWLLEREGSLLKDKNPFFEMMPQWFLIPGIVIATAAAIVASQALISGSFTLINEAIRLNFWPKVRVVYPTDMRGQLYVPSVNWVLLAGCIGITLFFKESSGMEAAYGLAIIITMLSTTTLLMYYLYLRRVSIYFIIFLMVLFLTVELSFLVANLDKFPHGGWLTLMIASALIFQMWGWYAARKIRNRFVEFVKLKDYLNLLRDLSHDFSIPKYATHLVYLTSANMSDEVEAKVIYSILQKQPKRADMYWFVHVDVMDEPYTMDYKVIELIKGNIIRIDFRLGFRVEPRINLMFRKVVEDMVKNFEVDITSRYESLGRKNLIGDFRFVVMEKFLSFENELPFYEKIILDFYFFFKRVSLSEERAFGLDTSSVTIEKVPLIVSPIGEVNLKRIK